MFLLNVPVAIERTEDIHVFIASQVLYYWINVFVTKKTIDCYEGYFITSSPEVFIVAHKWGQKQTFQNKPNRG